MRAKYLSEIIDDLYGLSYIKIAKPNFRKSEFNEEIMRVYIKLGGVENQYPAGYFKHDIICSNFSIELDEERHFNWYRLITLKSSIYQYTTYFDLESYKRFCNKYENNCLSAASWGKNWKTDSTERKFGESDPVGCLREKGSSRWKQRAFYDYLKDVASLITKRPLIRFSIWENTKNGKWLDDLLRCEQEEKLIDYTKAKIKKFKIR